ncbi:hypothetical protein [Winogradskyella sediminis]|uniref:SmpA / OmlA family protein n=1 Tax=Winogradskyella sediminis TaxID=1382466 RepID=A0A1H1R0U9_9FLAO|nr:hypothetical protein [Winogradskyella sediminis]REG89646.1 hypothetical protein C8N41_101888 [Winogradskyella sediminis]SDS29421.1 hypothetical protein SAMN04489797_1288 [Winogradskyella sediminis]
MYLDTPNNEPLKKRKRLKDYFDYRNNQINQMGLILFSAFVIATSLHFFFENRFTEEQWKSRPMTRHKMVDDLIDDHILIDKSKEDVINLLGEPSWILKSDKDIMLYELGLAPNRENNQVEHLYIQFINDKVNNVSLADYTSK